MLLPVFLLYLCTLYSVKGHTCNTQLKVRATKTNLTSANYPNNYHSNTECWWRLLAGGDEIVHIDVRDVDLDPYPVNGHTVTIYDGYDDRTPKLGELNVNSTSFSSTGKYIFVHFKGSIFGSEGTHRGFWLQYSAKRANFTRCVYDVTADTNTRYLLTPGYPGYTNNVNCTWTITAQKGYTEYVIRMEVLDSELEENCLFDNVSVYDGSSTSARRLAVWCGTNMPVLESSGSSLFLWFRTDSSQTKRGFQLKYYLIAEGSIRRTCGKHLTASGTPDYIVSPGHPLRYPSNLYCSWWITTRDSKAKVKLVVLNSYIESSAGCIADSVQIYSGRSNASKRIGRFCGGQLPTYETWGQNMFVEFHTNLDINDNGFRMKFIESHTCTPGYTDNVLADSKFRFLESPNYPQYYPNNYQCQWRITANSSYYIELITLTFQLERTGSCERDYVEIRDGSSEDSKTLGRFCGLSKPTLYTTGPDMFIQFKTDATKNFPGFRFQFRATKNVPVSKNDVEYLTVVMASVSSLCVFVAISLLVIFCIVRMRRKQRNILRTQTQMRINLQERDDMHRYYNYSQQNESFQIEAAACVMTPPPYHLVISDSRYGLPLDDPPPYPADEFVILGKHSSSDKLISTDGSNIATQPEVSTRSSNVTTNSPHEVLTLRCSPTAPPDVRELNVAHLDELSQESRTGLIAGADDTNFTSGTRSESSSEITANDSSGGKLPTMSSEVGLCDVTSSSSYDAQLENRRRESRDVSGDTSSKRSGCIETSV